MKRLVLTGLFLFLGVLVLGVSFRLETRARRVLAVAKEEVNRVDRVSQVEEGSEAGNLVVAEEEAVDYYLPYPGILPDHPLYWLKMVRDRVLLWLTRDPVAKVERLLLYADKRIGAALALVEGNQPELGTTTALKAEKYLEQTVASLEGLDEGVEGQFELRERVKRASLKHTEVLETIKAEVAGELAGSVDGVMVMTEKLLTELGVGVEEEVEELEEKEMTEVDKAGGEGSL